MSTPPLIPVVPAPEPRSAEVFTIKMANRYKAIVGTVIEYGDYATQAARAAGAKHFGVAPEQIDVEPIDARLRVRVKS